MAKVPIKFFSNVHQRELEFESLTECAKFFNIHPGSVGLALDRGSLENMGIGKGHNRKAVRIDGVVFRSRRAAGRYMGVSPQNFSCLVCRKIAKGITKFVYKGKLIETEWT